MKKFTFILTALFVATFANAQITLEHTFDHVIDFGWGIASLGGGNFGSDHRIIGNYLYEEDEDSGVIHIYDADDCTILKTITKEEATSYSFISKGIFSTDNKWSYITYKRTNTQGWDIGYEDCKYYYIIQVQTEDGTILATLNDKAFCEDFVTLAKIGDAYKLVVKKDGKYDYYSLPGNGEAQAITAPSSKYSARKIAREGQVLVETGTGTFDLKGQEVK